MLEEKTTILKQTVRAVVSTRLIVLRIVIRLRFARVFYVEPVFQLFFLLKHIKNSR